MRKVSEAGVSETCIHHDGTHVCLSLSESGDPGGSIPFAQRGWMMFMAHWPRAVGRRIAEAMLAMDDEVVGVSDASAAEAVLATLQQEATTSPSPEDVNERWSPRPGVKSTYIGDSVYASYDGFMLTIYTDNGFGPENVVHLEPGLLERVVEFRAQAHEQIKLEAEARDDAKG
jgi:hypothetical protein